MTLILADAGQVTYNGFTFDGASQVTIKCEPVYDDAQRTVVYHRYIVNVKATIASSGGTGLDLLNARALLTKAGGSLVVQNKGFYDIIVNGGTLGAVNDVAFGPKPKILAWEPIGSLYACEIVWECEACVAFCYLPKIHSGVMAFNYQISYALDYRGLTVRTIAGYYEIAMTRSGHAVPNTADAYRTVVSPTIPQRFQRTTQTYQVSLDKRRCDFNIVDTELPSDNPYPNGVVKIDAKHRVGWSRRSGQASKLRNIISVDVEMGADQPMLNAYAVFLAIIKKRMDVAKATYGNAVLLEDVSVEENMFERTCSFSVQYTILKTLKRILADTGLWQPLALNTWNAWAYSIQYLSDQRGYANLRHLAGNDAIVDPCGTVFTIPFDAAATERDKKTTNASTILKNEKPDAESSWLEYVAKVYVYRDRAIVRQAVLQQPESEDAAFDEQATSGLRYPATGTLADIIQRSGRSRYFAALVGKAKRVGHPIPRPALSQIGDAAVTEVRGDFDMHIDRNLFGVPVYVAKWCIEYALEVEPNTVLPMENVQQEVQADGTAEQPSAP